MKNLLFTLLLLGFPFMVSAQTERTIHVAKAGTLKDLIPENEKFQIEKLTLTGEINGTDFGFLREMAGVGIVCRDGNFDKTEGKLKILDLSKAEIVDGGDYYLRLEDVGRVLYLSNKSEFPSFVFYHCNFLTSVSIPNNVTTIGEYAFWGCNGLTSVSIPNSVKTIGDSAFGACSSLTSVTIPNSVTTFNMGAFQFSGLSAITIPNSMKSIDRYVFMGCNGLSSIKVESDNTTYDSRDNCNAIIETSSNTLIAGCKNSIIPNGVTSIGSDAFNGCIGLTSITYPNSLISIGSDAFSGCI